MASKHSNKDISFLPSGLLFWLVLLIPVVLRFLWPFDIEWKGDEKEMIRLAGDAISQGHVPGLGMKNGVGFYNAGFSVLPFIPLVWISNHPVFISMAVMFLNVLALAFMWYISGKYIPQTQIFRAGILLAAVNMMAVLFSRKIWAQDLIPVFIALIWYLHLARKNYGFDLLAGICIALAGQLHLSGFFLGFGFIFSLYLFKKASLRSIAVIIAGVFVGMIPALPWINYLMNGAGASDASLSNILKFEFFLHLLTDTLGINVHYPLGNDTMKFLRGYYYLPLVAGILIAITTLFSLWAVYIRLFQRHHGDRLWKPDISFYVWGFILIPGILLTISGTPVRSHYLIGCMPFAHIAFSSLLLKAGTKYYWTVWTAQLIITLFFMVYVHTNCDISGDYGTPFRCVNFQP